MVFLLALALPAVLLLGLYVWSLALTRSAERRFPPLGRFVEVEGVRLHFTDRGQGPAVLLVHGANSTLHDWEQGVAAELARNFRVLAFDRPGHGYSGRPAGRPATPGEQARLLQSALQKLSVDRPIVVGFSWAGALAMAYGLDYPDRVAGVVTIGGALYDWRSPIASVYQVPTWPVLGPIFSHTIVPVYAHLFAHDLTRDVFAPQPLSANFGGAPLQLAVRPTSFQNNAEERRLLKPFLEQQRQRYAQFRPPLTILVGTADRIVSPDIHSRQLHAAIPHSALIELPGAGHALPYTHPEAVVQAIQRTLSAAQVR